MHSAVRARRAHLRLPLRVELAEIDVAVVRVGDEVFAIEDVCSHADFPLSEGEVDGCTIECALHGSRFDLRTGKPTGPPATPPVTVFPTRSSTARSTPNSTHRSKSLIYKPELKPDSTILHETDQERTSMAQLEIRDLHVAGRTPRSSRASI